MNNESKFICVAPSKHEYDIYGNYLGESGERALYYSSDIGPHRIYRSSFPIEPYYFRGKDLNRKMKLLKYKTIQEAQSICDKINRIDKLILMTTYNHIIGTLNGTIAIEKENKYND